MISADERPVQPFKSGTVGAVWVAAQLGVHRQTAARLIRERGVGHAMSGGRLRLSLAEGASLVEELREEWDRELRREADTSE